MKKYIILLILILAACATNQVQEQTVNNVELPMSRMEDETMVKQVHAAHILVKTNEEANSILFDLNRGASFEDIAKNKSLCPSGKKGGDLGWFGRGQMVKEFENAAFSTPPGKISGIVKTQFGYHIIKVLEAK